MDADGSFRVATQPSRPPSAPSGVPERGPGVSSAEADAGSGAAEASDRLSDLTAPDLAAARAPSSAAAAAAGSAAAGLGSSGRGAGVNLADEGFRDSSGAGSRAAGRTTPNHISEPNPNPNMRLEPWRWATTWAVWRPRRAGLTRVSDVVLRLGAAAEVVWSLAAFPPGAPASVSADMHFC